jgi:hypothetical protein
MKGINFMIEVAISIIILSLGLFLLTKNYEKPILISKYRVEVFQALVSLDKNNNLRRFALENDATSINNTISQLLNKNIKHHVVIYNESSNTSAIPQIESKNIVVVDYLISGDFGNFSPRKIKVFIWD